MFINEWLCKECGCVIKQTTIKSFIPTIHRELDRSLLCIGSIQYLGSYEFYKESNT